jgi:aconitase B
MWLFGLVKKQVHMFPSLYCSIVAGTNGISPIFLTTVDVTGGIGLDLKNWVKVLMKRKCCS